MNPPFSLQQFLEIFKQYNEAVFPAQIILYLLAFVAIYCVSIIWRRAGKITGIILSLLWLWMGVVYHLIFFSSINPAAYVFGILFIIQALLFLYYAVFRDKLFFIFKPDRYGITGLFFIFYALIIYPVSGYLLGHSYPYAPGFGLPCPTVIFTFGFLLFSVEKCPPPLLIIPILWAIIGFTSVFQFGMYEDISLILTAVLSTIFLLYRNYSLAKKEECTHNMKAV